MNTELEAEPQLMTSVANEFEGQALNAVVGGFSFAAALSWMDLVRWTTHQVVKVQKNSGANYALTAVVTTLLSIIVYMVMSRISTRVNKPGKNVYAITR
jgi:di/tricarboxylate transporter